MGSIVNHGQSFRRPVAKLVLPRERGVIGSMGGGNVRLGLFTVKAEATSPRVDLRDWNTARSTKDLPQRGVIRVEECSKGTQRVARVLLLSNFEFLPETIGERGHWMIVRCGRIADNRQGADCGAE